MDHHRCTSANPTCNRSEWSSEENKAFENALAINLGEINQWEKIAAAVPGRTVEEIKNQFEFLCADINAIESGLVPLPEYAEPKMCAGHATTPAVKTKESEEEIVESGTNEGSSGSNGNKKKGRSWSPEEHTLFLEGLQKYGRGDWRSISRYCVVSRTAAQVASHAQKFFIRYGVNVVKKRSVVYDDEKKLVENPERQTNDLNDTEQIVANTRTDYPILESFDNYSVVYQNAGTSTPAKRPRSKRGGIGAPPCRVGLTSGMVVDQNTNHHHGISASSQRPRPEEIVETRCKKTVPVQEEPVLAPVVSTVDAPDGSGSGSSVESRNNYGASSFDFYSHDFMDVRDFELFFLTTDEK